MDILQKWLIVLACMIFAVGIFLHAFTGRYRLPILENDYSMGDQHAMIYYEARYDTWSGKLEVTQVTSKIDKKTGDFKLHWVDTPTCWIKDLK